MYVSSVNSTSSDACDRVPGSNAVSNFCHVHTIVTSSHARRSGPYSQWCFLKPVLGKRQIDSRNMLAGQSIPFTITAIPTVRLGCQSARRDPRKEGMQFSDLLPCRRRFSSDQASKPGTVAPRRAGVCCKSLKT